MYSQTTFAFDENLQAQVEAEIWGLEEAYISYFRDAAHDKVIPLWHDQFLGWPNSEFRPANKKAVVSYLKRVAPLPGNWSFEIERAGIQIYGDVAITHYIIHRTVNSSAGNDYKSSTWVTHTWIREDSHWKIIGGMSAKR